MNELSAYILTNIKKLRNNNKCLDDFIAHLYAEKIEFSICYITDKYGLHVSIGEGPDSINLVFTFDKKTKEYCGYSSHSPGFNRDNVRIYLNLLKDMKKIFKLQYNS